jgi:choline dehydrogenase-like flavoprotein
MLFNRSLATAAEMPSQALVTENGVVARTLLNRNVDTTVHYDVIVVGSGMGGGVLASALADAGKRVLVLEAGSLLFPTHIGNLPRRLLIGQFQKHIWSLWEDFKVINYNNVQGSAYQGGQGFNLGGRSIFWGSFIPPLASWELDAFPAVVKQHLLEAGPTGGYPAARRVFNADTPAPSNFQTTSKDTLNQTLPGWNAEDVPVGVEYTGATNWSIPAGIFSTADLIIEDQLVQRPPNLGSEREPLTVNLNHAARKVTFDAGDNRRATGVHCFDLLDKVERTYTADTIVLSAGTLESAKIALLSGINNPMIGHGVTDHAIPYRHFVIPPNALATTPPSETEPKSAKILLRHPAASRDAHAFDIIVELGAEFNQGRYVNPEHLEQDENIRAGYMLCEIVFQFYSPLLDANTITLNSSNPAGPVSVFMNAAPPVQPLINEARQLPTRVFAAYNAQPVLGERALLAADGLADLDTAEVGGVAHEVGSLRMAGDGNGVVDADLRFVGYKNLYACDNSVFPMSPAGNPSLTLVALAKRLAGHIQANPGTLRSLL